MDPPASADTIYIRDKLPSWALPELWAKWNVSFKPLSFGVVCCTPVGSENILSHHRALPASLPFLMVSSGPRTPSSFPSTSIFFGYQDKLLLFPKGFPDYSSLLWHIWPKPFLEPLLSPMCLRFFHCHVLTFQGQNLFLAPLFWSLCPSTASYIEGIKHMLRLLNVLILRLNSPNYLNQIYTGTNWKISSIIHFWLGI